MRLFTLILSAVIISTSALLCRQQIVESVSNQQDKYEYSQLNHVIYGLLNVDEWKSRLTFILYKEVDKLDFSRSDKQELKKHVEGLLSTLIDNVEARMKKESNWLTEALAGLFFSMKDIKKGIPEYADAIVQELTKPKTKLQLKKLLSKQLDQYIEKTYNPQDITPLYAIVERTGAKDMDGARAVLHKRMTAAENALVNRALYIVLLTLILFALPIFTREGLTPALCVLLGVSLVIVLTAGVTTPMIDLEAKITHIGFVLLNHEVVFDNQVLYFQSKSILDVFWIMIRYKEFMMKLVGMLVIAFSIIFPAIKLGASMVYYFDTKGRFRDNPVVKFFVMRSGKWSMADVMVVAIFMAYIGFNGIISHELENMKAAAPDLNFYTTNGTTLQPGYYLFLAYTLLAMLLTDMITQKTVPKD